MIRTDFCEITQHQSERWFERGLLLAAREGMELWCDYVRRYDETRLPSALNALGSLYLELGRTHEAFDLFEEALLLSGFEREVDEVRALCNMSLCQYLLGASSEAVTYAEMAKSRIEEHGITDDGLIAHVHLVLGLGYIAAGCWDRALQVNLRARAVLEELGDLAQVASILNNLGLIHVETGRYDEGEQLLLRTLSLYSELNDVLSTGYTFTELGRLYFKKGDLAAALRYGSRALSIFWEHKGLMDKAEVARLCELFGSIAHATGDRDGALNYMRRATTYYAQRGLWREWAGSSQELERILQTPPGAPTLAKAAIDWQDKQRLRFFTTLLGLMDTLESLYPSRRGKAELVTKYALILGEAAGLASGRLEELSHAARLHDVGLTSMETDLDQGLVTEELGMDHPLLGERVLKMFGVSDRVQLAVRHQHEHFDGSGGPDGLAGEQIPLYSRIIAVADAYVEQVLSSDDPKKAHTGAFGYVQSCAGRKFDPMIVDVFVRLHEV